MRVGIDTGGTFTDFAFFDGKELRFHKVPSTPHNPAEAVLGGLRDVLGDELAGVEIVHGTTVATNALLERKGAKVALVTTKGFEDVIEIGRQNRGKLYDFFWEPLLPLVPRELRFGVDERTTYEGRVLKQLDRPMAEDLVERVRGSAAEVIAISFLHSYENSRNEQAAEDALKVLGLPITSSYKMLPEFREYERTSTVVVNSYLFPKVKKYMQGLRDSLKGAKVFIMQSSGGVVSPEQAGEEPVRLLLSGPAGGVVGGYKVAESIGHKKVITYDMGGTSTDVYLSDGPLRFTTEAIFDGNPIKTPMVDVTTIGAGGGSIAFVDPGSALKVGPRSAGASPGPACYGVGTEATVTDANVVLGRIRPEWFLGGRMPIDPDLAHGAVERIATGLGLSTVETAEGIIRVSNATMERALRVISVERGYDPREFALLSFGGGGGLHACELARDMGIKTVISPPSPGTLSSLGALMADSFKDYSTTSFFRVIEGVDGSINEVFDSLKRRAEAEFPDENLTYELFADARYKRQSHELTIPYSINFVEDFHAEHNKQFGYSKLEGVVEVVTLRLRAFLAKHTLELPKLEVMGRNVGSEKVDLFYFGKEISAEAYRREEFFSGFTFSGPAQVLEETSTLFIPPGFTCAVDDFGNVIALNGD